jgi:hypothetical protein
MREIFKITAFLLDYLYYFKVLVEGAEVVLLIDEALVVGLVEALVVIDLE